MEILHQILVKYVHQIVQLVQEKVVLIVFLVLKIRYYLLMEQDKVDTAKVINNL